MSPRLRVQQNVLEGFILLDPNCFDVLSAEEQDSRLNQKILVQSMQKRIAKRVRCPLKYFRFLDEANRTSPEVINLFLGKRSTRDGIQSWGLDMKLNIAPFIPKEMVRNSSALWIELTRVNPLCLKHAPVTMKSNPRVVLSAIRNDGNAVAFCSSFLRLLNSIGLLGFYAALFRKDELKA